MGKNEAKNWDAEPLEVLMKHIVEKHHAYCRQELARLDALMDEAVEKCSDKQPELRRIKAVFATLRDELKMHLIKEEQTLFPYIARLEQAVTRREVFPRPAYGTVANPVRFMILEHGANYAELKEISSLSRGYEVPTGADPIVHSLYAALREFEADMQEHTILEDDVVFPRAIALEKAAETYAAPQNNTLPNS